MSKHPILIYGFRIPEVNVHQYINENITDDDTEYIGWEDWKLDSLAKEFNVRLLIARREYHDGESNDRESLISNCPLYICLRYTDKESFPQEFFDNKSDIEAFHNNKVKINKLLKLFHIKCHEPKYYLDYVDVDMGVEVF